ncbi:MAG TPA: hypothetical protein VF636_04870 [Sphingomonas sp.]|jgi:hypothetical protein
MHVIARWAHIDGDFATMFSHILKSDIEVGTAVYQAFNGTEARRLALFAAAEKGLPEWQAVALRAVWNAIKPSRDQRHQFAHHVWGFSEELPDALLLMHSSVIVERNISLRQRVQELPDGRGVIAPKDIDRSQVYVYRESDFKAAEQAAVEATFLVALLTMSIGHMTLEVGRRQLLNHPAFQRAVAPLIRERSPELQAQLAPPGNGPPAPGIWPEWDKQQGG